MVTIDSVAVIGLGLIGGSLVKAIKEKTDIKNIYAFSRTYSDVEAALRDGSVTEGFREISPELLSADIVFICTPVDRSIEILSEYRALFSGNTIITDVGSTKKEISKKAETIGLTNFIGGHPMAGSEKTGYKNSLPHLFENAFYILTPDEDTDREHLKKLVYIVSAIGAIPIILDPVKHDYITAAISHVPHVMASALVTLAQRQAAADPEIIRLAAGGFKDLTRIASSSPAMWESICVQNSENIVEVIGEYISELETFCALLRSGKQELLGRYFDKAKDFRDTLKDRTRSGYAQTFDISVDIEDKPGSIAKVATILAESAINVKNINIPANREFEDGCLILSFEDESTRIHALSALKKNEIKAYRR